MSMRLVQLGLSSFLVFIIASCTERVSGQNSTAIILPVMNSNGQLQSVQGFTAGPNVAAQTFTLSLTSPSASSTANRNPPVLMVNSMQSILQDPLVRQELSLTSEQLSAIDVRESSWNQKMSEVGNQAVEGSRADSDPTQVLNRLRELYRQQETEILDILVDHQTQRLREIAFQSLVRQHGVLAVITDQNYGEVFNVSEQQRKELKKRFADIEKEYNEKLERLKEETREKMLGELTPKQRVEFKNLFGEPLTKHRGDQ